jgi:hypothetical protein
MTSYNMYNMKNDTSWKKGKKEGGLTELDRLRLENKK